MIGRLVKVVACVGGAVLGIVLLLYVVAVAVNLRDAEPSVATERFTRLHQSRLAVADEDNGYVYLLGIAAPDDRNPLDVGRARAAWLREATAAAARNAAADPFPDARRWSANRPAETQSFLEACDSGIAQCAVAFRNSSAIVEAWTAAEPSLLPRYRELLARRAWREDVPGEVAFALPTYAYAADGQRLLLLSAYALAEAGDAAAVADLLESDLRFWRKVTESTDLLITKMVATNALARHFEWGNLVLRRLAASEARPAVPEDWRAPLRAAERSMVRVMTGEWIYVSATLRSQFDSLHTPNTAHDSVDAYLGRALFLPQDTSNRFAEYYWQLAELFDEPLERYEDALARAEDLAARTTANAFSWSTYNLGGAVVLANAADFTSYARRVNDIEGVRRAALAAATLRAEGVAAAQVATALEASDLRRPYDGTAFAWDAQEQSIVFRGLEPAVRGEHRLLY
jgi:hypothetical protein